MRDWHLHWDAPHPIVFNGLTVYATPSDAQLVRIEQWERGVLLSAVNIPVRVYGASRALTSTERRRRARTGGRYPIRVPKRVTLRVRVARVGQEPDAQDAQAALDYFRAPYRDLLRSARIA